MSDLVQELKAKLDIVALVSREFRVADRGRERECFRSGDAKVTSLKVYPEDQSWRWYGKAIERKQDVLGWIAFGKFNRPDVEGDQFVEVLREGCALAGLNFEEHQKSKGKSSPDFSARRKAEEILGRFMGAAKGLWTGEFYARAIQRKNYLTREVIERWELGVSPTLKQCLDAGLSEAELRSVNLLCKGESGDEYVYFRDSLLIPTLDCGRVIYISSRYFSDVNGRGEVREKKTLHLKLSPPGIPRRPAGFNLDCLRSAGVPPAREILLVEGPLDAIACTERGHAAIAMFCSTPAPELCERLRRKA